MDKSDKEYKQIKEFVTFAREVLKGDKGIKNMDRLVNADKLTEQQKIEIKQAFSTYFAGVLEYTGFTGSIIYKTGMINMASVEKICIKKEEDKTYFYQYMSVFQEIYSDVRRNLSDFMKKLNLDDNSAESKFVSTLFNDIGGELMDTIKSGGGTKDIGILIPKVFEMVKSGKLLTAFDKLKDGTVKISKILKAFTILVEEWENEGTVALTSGEPEVTTNLIEDAE